MDQKRIPSPHRQNLIYRATVTAIAILTIIIWCLTGCKVQKDGCASHRGMSGYTNYKK